MIPNEAARIPTEAEQCEIDAFQNGVYGAEPPEWWLNRVALSRIEADHLIDEME